MVREARQPATAVVPVQAAGAAAHYPAEQPPGRVVLVFDRVLRPLMTKSVSSWTLFEVTVKMGSLLKKMALNLIRTDTSDTAKAGLRRKRAAWDDDIRIAMLGIKPLWPPSSADLVCQAPYQ